ncbi:hypothetical protein R1flu_022392 [Riccia fluitans]|uniref:Uncharacterized protein n=1 Tax=Riccia fluitans TaxID=41844 RepID=A0ABD1ZUZ0_9MARC
MEVLEGVLAGVPPSQRALKALKPNNYRGGNCVSKVSYDEGIDSIRNLRLIPDSTLLFSAILVCGMEVTTSSGWCAEGGGVCLLTYSVFPRT